MAPAAPAVSGEATVTIPGVEFTGVNVFTHEQLTSLIAHEIGRPLSFAELQEMARVIEQHYHDSGYRLVKVVIPDQAFADGQHLKLAVFEGWLGNVEVEGNQRYSDSRVVQTLAAAGLQTSQAFTMEDAERALTLLNRRSGIEVSSTLRPGQEAGSTDMLVDVRESNRVAGSVEVNNYGSKNSGEHRVVPSLKLPNVTGRGDELNFIGMHTLDSGNAYFGYVAYQTPVNVVGTSVHAYASKGNVSIGREFKVLEIEGDSSSWGLGVSQDYVLSSRNIINLEAWLEAQNLEQTMLGFTTSDDRTRKLRFGASLDKSDIGGRTLASVNLHQGLGDTLGAMENDSAFSSRSYAGADNDFTKLTFDLIRLQRLSDRVLLMPRLSGQYAFDSVVASEQWSVGGFNSVLGHPSSAYSGDSGFTASLEGRYALIQGDDRFQLLARADHGQVFIKTPFIDQDDSTDISGFGIGLLVRPIDSVDLRVDWGVPVGSKTEDSSYVYAQARYRF
ncbi:ShlB/FhaC/HecB family hemolysin secretion/activation protein [Halomonas sp. KM-1]|uniref:ShlB/FhaC/HecB family hemolysin secretion/activation protein n=1 Tax=Halomonas sp. KM-1 TaxID=590061 RepID=UPI001EE67938|nr:ShlB/FhaC/HecB family hemolysin secretion/activation protein [Halomonas sp. KM-1]